MSNSNKIQPLLPEELSSKGFYLTACEEMVFYQATEEGFEHPLEIIIDDHYNEEALNSGYYIATGSIGPCYAVAISIAGDVTYIGAGISVEDAVDMAVHNHKCREEWQ